MPLGVLSVDHQPAAVVDRAGSDLIRQDGHVVWPVVPGDRVIPPPLGTDPRGLLVLRVEPGGQLHRAVLDQGLVDPRGLGLGRLGVEPALVLELAVPLAVTEVPQVVARGFLSRDVDSVAGRVVLDDRDAVPALGRPLGLGRRIVERAFRPRKNPVGWDRCHRGYQPLPATLEDSTGLANPVAQDLLDGDSHTPSIMPLGKMGIATWGILICIRNGAAKTTCGRRKERPRREPAGRL